MSYSFLASVDLSRYIALDAELMHIETTQGFDDFDEVTRFGAQGAAISARVQWPLAEDFKAYIRAGAVWLDLDEGAALRGEPLPSNVTQPALGFGVRGNRWFLEYVYYGEVEDLHLEQLRGGLIYRF